MDSTPDTNEEQEPSLYRIEHRSGTRAHVLARVADVSLHFSVLDPWASSLLQSGASGFLVLIDERTEEVKARRQLERAPNPKRRRLRAGERPVARRFPAGQQNRRTPSALN